MEIKTHNIFTLIEVLVVLAIVGVMASLLVPVMVRAHDQAKMLNCQNNAKQISFGITYYTEDQDGCFPYLPEGALSGLGQSGWPVAIDEYIGGKFDYLQNWGTDEWKDFYPQCSALWYCPATEGIFLPWVNKIHYGLNISQKGASRTSNDGSLTTGELPGSKLTSLLNPVSRALIADTNHTGTQEGLWRHEDLVSAAFGASWFRKSRFAEDGFTRRAAPRHREFSAVNIGFMDGHADDWKHQPFINDEAFQNDREVQAFFGNFIFFPKKNEGNIK